MQRWTKVKRKRISSKKFSRNSNEKPILYISYKSHKSIHNKSWKLLTIKIKNTYGACIFTSCNMDYWSLIFIRHCRSSLFEQQLLTRLVYSFSELLFAHDTYFVLRFHFLIKLIHVKVVLSYSSKLLNNCLMHLRVWGGWNCVWMWGWERVVQYILFSCTLEREQPHRIRKSDFNNRMRTQFNSS